MRFPGEELECGRRAWDHTLRNSQKKAGERSTREDEISVPKVLCKIFGHNLKESPLEIITNYKGEKSNFKVERPGRHYSNQTIKANLLAMR